ncbi:PrpF domain-containing protein [Actinomadura rupiterrae]|uniref:PrpF domain-containing protein n=1 Tax=Actinomadura rupiterrae TaxID=559627 RepID=UPI0020A437C3|nr:PrpF domain-containing protein [Actinomadura rupiterrae]MCP2335763.1 4-oxalomesaconate tautomerase [Actinomadura rupiterrae]
MIRAALLRGGTSKGVYLDAADLPADPAERDDLLLRLLGSPDPRQTDGLGGGHPLTSKVAVVSGAADPSTADVDYLFLQVHVDRPLVSAEQPCGNILAGIGPYARLRGLVPPDAGTVRIRMVNTGGLVIASLGPGAPGDEIEVALEFQETAGSVCGSLLPTGNVRDEIDGIPVTCIDNGMPVVLAAAADFDLTGHEPPGVLEADERLAARRERVRLRAGELMGLGDVAGATVPKITLVAPPRAGGTLATRTFIPHRCHPAIGVLGAVSVATAAGLPGSVAAPYATGGDLIRLEHPTGHFDTRLTSSGGAAVLRTARLLSDGTAWPRPSHRS